MPSLITPSVRRPWSRNPPESEGAAMDHLREGSPRVYGREEVEAHGDRPVPPKTSYTLVKGVHEAPPSLDCSPCSGALAATGQRRCQPVLRFPVALHPFPRPDAITCWARPCWGPSPPVLRIAVLAAVASGAWKRPSGGCPGSTSPAWATRGAAPRIQPMRRCAAAPRATPKWCGWCGTPQ